jgi:hypothetical protein
MLPHSECIRPLVLHHINFEGEGLNRKDAKYAKEEGKKRNGKKVHPS